MFVDVTSSEFGKIISLDMEKEEFLTIKFPPQEPKPTFHYRLVGLNGLLSLIHCTPDVGTSYIDIWMLKDPRISMWAKEYNIKFTVHFYIV